MKIIHISNDYRNNNLYESLFTLLAEQLTQTVFVPYKTQIDIKQNNKYKVIHDVCYRNIDRYFFEKKGRKIYKVFNEKVGISDYDLIHAHSMFSNGIIAYMSKIHHGIDYVISVRNVDIDFFMKRFIHLRKKGIEILLNAKKVIFISPMIKQKFFNYINNENTREILERKSIVITNGIDDFWFKNRYASEIRNNNELSILQVGRICKNKNQINSVKAIELLNNNNISCRLDIIGGVANNKDKTYYKNLLKYISNRNHRNKFRVIDKKSKEELISYYRNADIFLMPSYSETFGLVYIEALSQGIPIVYSNNQGVDGLFEEKPVGIGINPNDPHDIAKGIKAASENYDQLSKNISVQLNQFKWDNVVKEFFEIYEEIQQY